MSCIIQCLKWTWIYLGVDVSKPVDTYYDDTDGVTGNTGELTKWILSLSIEVHVDLIVAFALLKIRGKDSNTGRTV